MIVNVDAKSLEWVTMLYLSQDPVGIKEWKDVLADPSKNDIHTANQMAFNLPSRLIAKVFLFRWIYLGSAYAYSKDPDFVSVSKDVDFWQQVIDKYYFKYKKIKELHNHYVKEATTKGKIISPFGREYLYPPIKDKWGNNKWNESTMANYPNQGLGADCMAVIRVYVYNRFRDLRLTGKLVSTVHDSIVVDCPDNEVEVVSKLFYDAFIKAPEMISKAFDVDFNVPMLGEISVGPNMADLTELKINANSN